MKNFEGENGTSSKANGIDESYRMNHGRRGLALIFNHSSFEDTLKLTKRPGTEVDKDKLKLSLSRLGFDVQTYNDLTHKKLFEALDEVSKLDHTDADCILVAVLSHGQKGKLFSHDTCYKTEEIWEKFAPEVCPSLAGKPKLFVIQACQGEQFDDGILLMEGNVSEEFRLQEIEINNMENNYEPPSFTTSPMPEDFLILYSTIPGFYSWRNSHSGSWFIQSLCHVLDTRGRDEELVSNITRVIRIVSTKYESVTQHILTDQKKQVSCQRSTLLKEVYFPLKPEPIFD